MGFFTKDSRDLCYFCNNDYFELLKTLDNNFVCRDCLVSTNIPEGEIAFMRLDEVIKSRETASVGDSKAASHDTYCSACNKHILSGSKDYISLNTVDYCKTCGSEKIRTIDKNILITASNALPGYEIEKQIDLAGVEALINLGYNMNFEGQTIFGMQNVDKEMKFKEAKSAAILKLKIEAANQGGDAVVGIGLSSTVFYDKRSVVATGTVVKLRKI